MEEDQHFHDGNNPEAQPYKQEYTGEKAASVYQEVSDDTRENFRPWVTIAIIAVCIGVFLLDQGFPRVGNQMLFAPVIGDIQPWRFLTAAFVHSGIWHILLNMYALWIIGSVLEHAIGRWRFFFLYILSAIGGNIAVLALANPYTESWITLTVGASGAVFGLFGAYAVILKSFNANMTSMLVIIGLNLALSFVVANISWQAHIGGLISGVILAGGLVLRRKQTPGRYLLARDVAVFAFFTLLLLGVGTYIYAGVPSVLGYH